jgi:hypothetical protein
MPIIAKITSSAAGKIVTDINARSLPTPIRAAAKPATGRVYQVPREQLVLLQRAGITPPANAGELLSVADIDHKLSSAGLTVAQRFEVKNALRNLGLLAPGLPR